MKYSKLVACASAAVLATAVACSKNSDTPVSPTGAQPAPVEAAADGSTLKATAPTPQSPINNQQPEQLVFTAGRSSAPFEGSAANAFSYEFQVRRGTTTICTATVGAAGNNVSWTPGAACQLDFDAAYTWRVRATFQNAVGPWSADATFRTPIGGYITSNEIYDPLWNGRTVGDMTNATFVQGQGLRLNGHNSRVTYVFNQPLQQGEYSLMSTGYGEDSPGDKTKMMSMQEGFGDLTANDYRFTAEKRGRSYSTPGAVQFRIIMGDSGEEHRIFDSARIGIEFSDEKWYFWKFTWGTGRAALEVREDGPGGRIIYADSRGTGGFAYRPLPHVIHVGANLSRAGEQDSSIPGALYKNIWVSSRPRPNFPNE